MFPFTPFADPRSSETGICATAAAPSSRRNSCGEKPIVTFLLIPHPLCSSIQAYARPPPLALVKRRVVIDH